MMLHGDQAIRNAPNAGNSIQRDTQQEIARQDARLTGTQSSQRRSLEASMSGEPEDFAQNLREKVMNIRDPLPRQLLRKYIAYCRRYCNPQLSRGAAKVLQNFYLEVRNTLICG